MIKRKSLSRKPQEAELDITAFMNLMIVLVPVLLLGLVFSRITVVDLTIPPAALGGDGKADEQKLELVIHPQHMTVNYPRGIRLKRIALDDTGDYDYETLSLVLQELKRQLAEQGIEKRAITILSPPETDYQTIISTIDTVRSFKAVVVASVVDAELFPNVSFGDAPIVEAPAP